MVARAGLSRLISAILRTRIVEAESLGLIGWIRPGEGPPGMAIDVRRDPAHLGKRSTFTARPDLLPHHENRWRKAAARCGAPLANYWVHTAASTGLQKMSQSIVTRNACRTLRWPQGRDAAAALLSAHIARRSWPTPACTAKALLAFSGLPRCHSRRAGPFGRGSAW